MNDKTTSTTDEKEKKEIKPPAESLFVDYLIKSGNYAVQKDLNGVPMMHEWDKSERYWKALTTEELQTRAVTWLTNNDPMRYSDRNVNACVSLAPKHVNSFGRKLEKNDDFTISTISHILKVTSEGKIEVVNKIENPSEAKKNFCRTHISIELGNIGNYYFPETDEKIESDGLLAKLAKSSFPSVENRRAFQEFFGDTLNPTLRKAFPIMLGPPNGGKSQWIEAAMKLHSNSCAVDICSDGGFDFEQVIGKSLVVVDEIGESPNARILKQLVGGAAMPIQRKHKSNLTITPDFKFIAGDNGTFKFNEKTGAIETRIYMFEVASVKVEDRIDQIAKKIIKKEMRKLFDWCLNGAVRVVKRGRILRHDELPNESQALISNMKTETNPCVDFLKDFGAVFDQNGLIPKQDIYEQFKTWCMTVGRANFSKVSLNVFCRDLFPTAITTVDPNYNSDLERRASRKIGMEKKRVECLPIRLTNAPGVKVYHVEQSDVESTYSDPEAYSHKRKLPEHLLEKINKEVEAMNQIIKMNEEQKRQVRESRLKAEGFTQEADGTWSKGSDIDF